MSVAAAALNDQDHLESWTINSRWRRRSRPRRRRDGPLAVARAIPDRHARASSQAQWRRDLDHHPDLLLRRSDAIRAIKDVAAVLANWADWHTMLSRPTHAEISRRTGLSTRTVTRHIAWLLNAGMLGLVSPGTTPHLSPGVLRAAAGESERNDAAVYVLIAPDALRLVAIPWPASEDLGYEWVDVSELHEEPEDVGGGLNDPPPLMAVDKNGHPSGSPKGRKNPLRARSFRNHQDIAPVEQPPPWSGTQRPASKAERRLAAVELQGRVPVLNRISTAYVAALAREWHLAGWTVNDILTALQQRPDNAGRWTNTDDIRHVPGWFRHRLNAWRRDPADRTSPPSTSPTRRLEAEERRVKAARRARAERERSDARASLSPGQAAAWTERLRADLLNHRRRRNGY